MTREEQERMKRQSAAILANAQGNFSAAPENMLSQTAGGTDLLKRANQDFSGRESAIANQRKLAASMMGKGPAKGKQVGDLYFAPTWSEIAANAAGELAGGLSQRSANKKAEGLGRDKSDAAVAQAKYDQQQLDQQRDWDAGQTGRLIKSREGISGDDRTSRETVAQTALDSRVMEGRLNRATENLNANRGLLDRRLERGDDMLGDEVKAQALLDSQNLDRAEAATETYHDPSKPNDPNATITYGRDKNNNYINSDGTPVPQEEAERIKYLTPYAASTTQGSRPRTQAQIDAAAVAGQDPGLGEGNIDPNVVMDIMDADDILEKATGFFDPNKYLGWGGYGEKGADVQSLQLKMGTVLIDQLSQNAEKAKLTPISDYEAKLLQRNAPNENSQPKTWTDWAATTIRPFFDKRFDKAIKDGAQTPEGKAKYMADMDRSIVRRALRADTNYPVEKMVAAGVSPQIIAEEQAKKKASEASRAKSTEEIDKMKARLAVLEEGQREANE